MSMNPATDELMGPPKAKAAPPPPELVVDKIFKEVARFSEDLFGTYAEPLSVGFVVHWANGNLEYPSGIMFTRDNKFKVQAVLSLAEQTTKFAQQLFSAATKNMNDAKIANERMTAILLQKQELIKAAEEKLRQLTQEINERTGNASTGDPRRGDTFAPQSAR